MSASLDLGPSKKSPLSMFFEQQFFTSIQWTPKDTNLVGKVAIVTGSTSGLGLEASRQLLSFGLSKLIIPARSKERGEEIASKVRIENPKSDIQVWVLDMASYDSVQAFAHRANTELSRLDIAILNAGTQDVHFTVIPSTGHERVMQVNYLSTMLLAILLLPILKAKSSPGQPGRLSIVSSGTPHGATISEPAGSPILTAFDDKSRSWNPVERYAASKLLGHLFIVDLATYVRADDVIVNLVDPGVIKNTGLQRDAPLILAPLFWLFKATCGLSLPVGASTYIDATVVKGKETHGSFLANWKISSFAAFVYTPEGAAVREQLWNETMTEFEFAGAQAKLNELNTKDSDATLTTS